MVARTFKKFPKDLICPVCGTNENKECFLLPIDGTQDGNIEEAQATHTECVPINSLRLNKKAGLIYLKI